MMVLITPACGEGSDEPACTHDLDWALASRINNVYKLKKTPNNFALGTPELAIIRGFFGYAVRPNLVFYALFS